MSRFLRRRFRDATSASQDGFALILVVGMMFVVTIVLTGLLSYVLNNLKPSRRDQDTAAAGQAAQAGLDAYLSAVYADPTYPFTFSGFWTSPSTWCATSSNATDPRCGWQPVPGATNSSQFRFDQVTSPALVAKSGAITVSASGRVNGIVRTVQGTLRRASFLQYVYTSDKEVIDPADSLAYCSQALDSNGRNYFTVQNADGSYACTANAIYNNNPKSSDPTMSDTNPAQYCGTYYNWQVTPWQSTPYASRDTAGLSASNARCQFKNWTAKDDFSGDYHSNDMFYASGSPVFEGKVTTDCPATVCTGKSGATQFINTGSANPVNASGNAIKFQTPSYLALPPANTLLKSYAQSPAYLGGGYYCQGPTRAILHSDGTMELDSPYSVNTSTNAALNCPNGASVPQPPNGILYVDAIPTTDTTNYNAATNQMNTIIPQKEGSTLCGVGTKGKPWVTQTGAVPASSGGPYFPDCRDSTNYSIYDGDLWLEGTLNGQLTADAADRIIITGNTTYNTAYNNGSSDILGLIASNQIQLYHPVTQLLPNLLSSVSALSGCNSDCSDNALQKAIKGFTTTEVCPAPCMKNIEIDGSILSLQHSFASQNYVQGDDKVMITVIGSINQKYRGSTGGGAGNAGDHTGYDHNYKYDPRLQYLQPPFFLNPVAAAWSIHTYKDVKPAY